MMDEQREFALADKRNRIINSAKRMLTVRFEKYARSRNSEKTDTYENSIIYRYNFIVSIEIKNDSILSFDFKHWLENLYYDILDTDNPNLASIADNLYEQIASRYPNREIVISISDNNSEFTITYRTHLPLHQLAI